MSSTVKKRAEAFEIDFCLIEHGLTVSEINNILKDKLEKWPVLTTLYWGVTSNLLIPHLQRVNKRTLRDIDIPVLAHFRYPFGAFSLPSATFRWF